MELTIDQALQRGIEAHRSGKVQEADRFYTTIITAHPKHPDANHNMGVLAVSVGKTQEALPFFKTALEANPNIGQFWLSYIDALVRLERLSDAQAVFDQVKSKGANGSGFDKLEQRLEGVEPSKTKASQNQDPPQDQLQPLISLYSRGQFQQALIKTTQLLQQFSKSSLLHNISGAIYSGLGQLDAAITAYNEAIANNPYQPDTHYNVGISLKKQGKLDAAIDAYNQALALKPDYADAYNNMGIALKEKGKLVEAIRAYKKALAIKPDYAAAFNNMGNAFKEQGKLEKALVAYNKALTLKPDYAEAHHSSGAIFQSQGKLEKAIVAYNKALALRPNYAEVYNEMGGALLLQGKLEEAKEAYKKVLSIKPKSAQAKHMLSSITGKTTNSAPREYVENLFDGYANKFEQSLVEELEYNIPKILTNLVAKQHGNRSWGSVLDLGCGTGLTGVEIKEFCSNLEGIDLSDKMLDQAKIKNVYNKLTHVDILYYLSIAELNFDYFISTDVFVYVGNLSEVFRLIKYRNKKPGKLVFSTEHTEKDGFHLEKSGRYSHSKGYIDSLCEEFNFSILHFSETSLRKEKNIFLTGGLYLLSF